MSERVDWRNTIPYRVRPAVVALVKGISGSASTVEAATPSDAPVVAGPRPGRIESLVVTADLEAGECVAEHLTDDGSHVTITKTTADAFRAMDSSAPDIVLVGADLPDGSACELLAAIRARCPDAVRALMTDEADPQLLRDALEVAAVHRVLLRPRERSPQHLLGELVTEALARRAKVERKRATVLVYGDRLRTLLEPLSADGLGVCVVDDVESAHARLSRDRLDLLLCDAACVGASRVVRRARNRLPDIRRVLFTDHAGPDLLIDAINEYGVERVIEGEPGPDTARAVLAMLRHITPGG